MSDNKPEEQRDKTLGEKDWRKMPNGIEKMFAAEEAGLSTEVRSPPSQDKTLGEIAYEEWNAIVHSSDGVPWQQVGMQVGWENIAQAVAAEEVRRAKIDIESLKEELESCAHCKGTGDGYCDEDGWHDCLKCNGTGLKTGVRQLAKQAELIRVLVEALKMATLFLPTAGLTLRKAQEALRKAEGAA